MFILLFHLSIVKIFVLAYNINGMRIEEHIVKTLINKRFTLAVAESCTGGLLSSRLTDVPGASRCFLMALVAYSNEAKINLLKIPPSLIKTKGAVSEEVALLMAKNIRRLSASNIGIGITGIAGPTGGSKTKPVGLVYIALASKNKDIQEKFVFGGSRLEIKQKATTQALILLKRFLE